MDNWSIEATLDLCKLALKPRRGRGRARHRKKAEKLALAHPCPRCGVVHRWVHPKRRPTEENLARMIANAIQAEEDLKVFHVE